MSVVTCDHMILDTLAPSEKQILDFIYRWSRPIRAGDLSEQLNIKHTTLNSQLQSLEAKNLVIWKRYGSIYLTKAGERIAAHLVRHHRLLESFFHEFLQMKAEDAHNESVRLFPYVSCALMNRVSQYVESNTICPCGYPIPELPTCVPEMEMRE